jgi:hypothetical protein
MKSYFLFTQKMNNYLSGYLFPQKGSVAAAGSTAWNVDNSDFT